MALAGMGLPQAGQGMFGFGKDAHSVSMSKCWAATMYFWLPMIPKREKRSPVCQAALASLTKVCMYLLQTSVALANASRLGFGASLQNTPMRVRSLSSIEGG